MLLSMHNAVTCNTNFLRQMCSSVVHQSRCQSLSDWTWRQPAVKRTTECCRRLHPRRSWKTRCTGGSGADCTDATDSADAIVDVIVFLLDTLSAAPGCCQRTIANDHVQIMSQKLIRDKRANRFEQITSVQSACARSFKFQLPPCVSESDLSVSNLKRNPLDVSDERPFPEFGAIP